MTYNGSNLMASAAFAKLEEHISHWTANSAQLAASKGERKEALNAWAKGTDNERAVELRELLAKAKAELLSLAEANVPNVTLDESDVVKLGTEQDTIKTQIRAGFAMAGKVLSFDNDDADAVKAYLEGLSDPTKGSRSGNGEGHTGPRAAAYVWVEHEVNGAVAPGKGTFDEEKNSDAFKSFSWAAKAVQTTTEDLVRAFAEAAGVEYGDVGSVDTAQEFAFTAKGGQAVWIIRTEPKPRASAK